MRKRRCHLSHVHDVSLAHHAHLVDTSGVYLSRSVDYLQGCMNGDLEAMNHAVQECGKDAEWCEQRMRENRVDAVLFAFDQQDLQTVRRLLLEVADDREQLDGLLEVLLCYAMEE